MPTLISARVFFIPLLFCLLLPLPSRAALSVLQRETFQAVGTLNASAVGVFSGLANGSIQKRAVGPRTSAVAAPGWSGDMQGAATDAYFDLTNGPYSAAQAGGTLGCWVRFVDFTAAGYFNNAGSACPAMILQLIRTDGDRCEQGIGVTGSGHLVAISPSGFIDGGAIAANTWYWLQVAWLKSNDVRTMFASYQPLGGTAVVINTCTEGGGDIGTVHVLNQSFTQPPPPGQDYRWRGRVGNVTLCSLTSLSDAAIPADDIAPSTAPVTWYVNPATGSDTNTGIAASSAWATVTKFNAESANAGMNAGDTLIIDTTTANLMIGPSSLDINTPGLNVVQLGGGLTGTGEIQAWENISGAGWTLTAGTTHVYRRTLSSTDVGAVMWEDDEWLNHPTGANLAAVQASLESLPGSFWTDGTTMCVHPFGDTNPATDGKVYTRSYNRGGYGASAVQVNAPNWHLNGLRVRKTCLANPANNDPYAAYGFQTQGNLDGSGFSENCFVDYYSKHGFGYTDNSLTRTYVTRNCQAEQGSAYVGTGGQTAWVDYANNPGSNGTATSDYSDCRTNNNSGLIGSTAGQYSPDQPAWISHNSGAGTMQFARQSFTNCNLAGGVSTGISPVFNWTGGSCQGGAFGDATIATIDRCLVPGGQPFVGAQTTVHNSILVINRLNDGFEPQIHGTLAYVGCTFDLRATTTNYGNHALFARVDALSMTFRNNLVLGSSAFHFAILRGGTFNDALGFDHNAYADVSAVALNYNDGVATSDRTLAQWQAIGRDVGSFASTDLMLDANDFPTAKSPVVDAGANLGGVTDFSGRFFNHRRTIGGLEPLDTFARWQEQHFSTADIANAAVSGPNADPDGDGLPNLLEYALCSAPNVANSGAVVTAVQNIAGQPYLTLTYTRLTYSSDLTYLPQTSFDLLHWQGDTSADVITSTTDNSDGTEVCVIRNTHPLGAFTRRFLRLQVSIPSTGETGYGSQTGRVKQ